MRILRTVTALAALLITAYSQAQNFTNKGTEFWVGYGHHQFMETSCDGLTQGSNTQNMVLYLSAEQAATVTITLDSSGSAFPPLAAWSKTYNIPANTVIQSDIIPKGPIDAVASGSNSNYDARLFSNFGGEEIFRKRGIHIVSNVPIVAYAHIYGSVSSGATMLLPIDTWGYSYTSINSEQHDASQSFSWMYVVAKDDNTRVRITPSAVSRLGKPAGVPFTVDLQKGQIYQLIGQSVCATGNGVELTGTTVKSIIGADGICHKIGVFSGSSRTAGETAACGSAGRDNDMQQCFPEVAWGKAYLTTPFSKATSGTSLQANQFQTSVYKVVVKDPATIVKKNGVVMTGLIGNKYYKYVSNTADYIQADKPVMIAQYMVSGGLSCSSSQGDPEMVYISPLEQAISNIGFFRNNKEAIVANYLTLVVPTAGLSSLRINNSQLFDYTYPHPQNALLGTPYTVVVKGWTATQSQVLVKCDSAFNAITYGLGGAESYGFNAGTYLKNLNATGEIFNIPDTTNTVRPFTCTGTPMQISALIAYKPSSMNWKISSLGTVVSPNTDVFVSNPTPLDSVTIGIAKYYRYKLPGTYIFNTAGSYDLPIVCTSTDIDNCSLQETVQIKIEVKARPSSDFTFTHSGCRTDSVSFFGPSNTGTYNVAAWSWIFDDATTSATKNPKKLYNTTGSHPVSLVATSTEGCLSDTTTKNVVISAARAASIFASPQTGCEGASITFTDTTTVTSGTFYWNFGTGAPVTVNSNTPQTFTYTLPGQYIVKHVISPAGNCLSDTVYKTITINPKPGKPIAASPFTYCQNATAVPLTATALNGHSLTWYSVFPLTGGSATAPTPSTTAAGTFYYYVTQTSPTGCTSDTTKIQVDITPAIANNTVAADQIVCSGTAPAGLTATAPTGGTNSYAYQWQQSTDGGTTWTPIAGAISDTYTPGVLSTGITQFRRVVTSGLCSNTSNAVSITVQTNLSNYNIGANQTICDGATPALLIGQQPTGGTGSYSYQWESSANASGPWTPIAGATVKDYQPGTLTASTYYRRTATGGNCPAISNVVAIIVNPTANGSIAAVGPTNLCQTQTGTISLTATSGTAPFTFKILVTAPGGTTTLLTQVLPSNGPTNLVVVPVASPGGPYTVALVSISDAGGCIRSTGLNTVTFTVTATPTVTVNPTAAAVCAGLSVTLTAGGASSFTWSPATGLSATTGATVTANPTATTTYNITGTTNGCTGTASVTVTVNPIPAKPLAAQSAFIYCQNSTATPLSATALPGHTLQWYTTYPLTGGSATAPTPSTTTAGAYAYYVTQTNATGCVSDTTTITVTVNAAITGNTISSTQTVCDGTAPAGLTGGGTLSGGVANTYAYQWQISINGGTTWTNIAGATLANYNPGILPAGVTMFRRIVTSGVCSTTSNTVIITVEQSLTNYGIGAAQTVCEGVTPALLIGQSPLGGTGSYNYTWQNSLDNITWTAIPAATAKDYQPPLLTSNTYYRRITSGGNCPATSNVILITVNPAPAGTIPASLTGICSYQTGSVVFTATAGTAPFAITLVITAPGGGTSTINQNIASNGPVSITVLPLNSAAGTYTVQLASITDSKGCTKTTGLPTSTIVVTAKPKVTVTASATTICQQSTTTLTANGAASYTWTPSTGLSGITGSPVTATPLVNTTYTVIGSTTGCADTAAITINVVALPAKPVVTRPVDYCLNATATALTATATAGNTLQWYNNPSLTGGSTVAPVPSTATLGAYTYYVTQTNSTGCVSDTSAIAVTIHPQPLVDFTLPGGICMPNGVALFGNKTTVADNSNLTYAWNFGDGTGTSAAASPSYTYAVSGSYPVKLTATSSYGCTASKTQTFSSFYEKPVALFDVNPTELCQGQNNSFIDKSNPMGSNITKWWWSFGDGTTPGASGSPSHRYTKPGTFTVKLVVTTAIGCVSDTISQDVIVHLQPKIDAGPSFVVPQGTTIQFLATANDTTVSLYWTPPFGLSDPTKLRPSLVALQNQTYTLTAVGDFNCTATDTMSVRILKPIEVPNAFSPNGDGTNDTWLIPNLADYPGAKVEIYNRWGQQIFLSYGYNKPWDGTFLGKALPLATYYYIISLNNGFKPVTGSVTIIK